MDEILLESLAGSLCLVGPMALVLRLAVCLDLGKMTFARFWGVRYDRFSGYRSSKFVLGHWRSWLARLVDIEEVTGSSPVWPITAKRPANRRAFCVQDQSLALHYYPKSAGLMVGPKAVI